ncbi:amiloride-sensitive sodium channel pickpocket 17 isoform 2-T2 [Cochliomyia hominivorax]
MGYWSELRAWLLKDPAKIIRYLVLFICCVVVIVQLYECFSKLDNPPISTHSYYNLNETIEMPAVTVCRDPPYKNEELTNISGKTCEHPKYSSCWSNYPYEDVELIDFFTYSTFDESETFAECQYGLNGLIDNVEITSSLHFYMGRCHTIRPKISLKRASKLTGYSIMLKHHLTKEDIKSKYFEQPPGWHLFMHDLRENFTEINMKASGRVEYVFADINENIEIKLQSQYFSNIETKQLSCSRKDGYSDLKCGEVCIWHEIGRKSNCSGPWMHDAHFAPCSNYKSIMKLIGEYGRIYNSDDDFECDCVQPCESRIFSAYIQNRKPFEYEEPNTQVYIYYTTKLISMIEERPSYDTTQFIADVGGSLGFLLGLSVLSLIGILEHMTLLLCGGVIKKMQHKNEKQLKVNEENDKSSDTTVDIATIYANKY